MPTSLKADSVGPVDVAVVVFEGDRFNGDIAPALRDLHDSGTVRLLDLAFVRRSPEGSVDIVELEDAEVAEAFARTTDGRFDLLSEEDLQGVAGDLAPGSSALVVAWENAWASRLAAALRGSHGEMVFLERIPRDDVERAIAALDEQ
ncbi:DUF6325 family protein [Streptomyces sp. NBC_00102]|uniref:DUF6325 family protein n=1 Tax=Streptomyces sp. NBC_00102 TaxID=2975652 RepID=UPI00225A885F|nr:DUF6325 family protein [Streptomyces sp. NBC_00102]MCX5402117.1 DUF6325 family protein [Streptomyces sp. NBC_00102]